MVGRNGATRHLSMRATLPLLSFIEGRKPRLRKSATNRPKEVVLHMAVAKVLRDHAITTWQWTHIASGELRDVRTAVKLKQMGVRRGWPDFVLVPSTGQMHCLELKREGEKLTDAQRDFESWCNAGAIPHAVAFTLDDALAVLDSWGCLRIKITRRSPT